MKTTKQTPLLYSLIAVLVLSFTSACSLGDLNSEIESNNLTPAELEEASLILGQALSDDTDGVFGSINDALSNVSSNGFTTQTALKGMNDDDDSGRGSERNYSYNYNLETGVHSISFQRSVNKPNFAKSLTAEMTYIFTDVDSNFISQPRVNRDLIEDIDFTSFKSGDTEAPYRSSDFSRADTFAIRGLSDASTTLIIDGIHNGNGSMNAVRKNGETFEKSFANQIIFTDITIDKAVVQQNGDLTAGVTGTLSYEMTMFKNNNGNQETKNVSGTIELTGDGTALLRFQNFEKLFKVNLNTGFVQSEDDEIESLVVSVNLNQRTVLLENGITVRITGRTEFEGDNNLNSLVDVDAALSAGSTIMAEVEGFRTPENRNVVIAEEIEFDFHEGDDDDEDDN